MKNSLGHNEAFCSKIEELKGKAPFLSQIYILGNSYAQGIPGKAAEFCFYLENKLNRPLAKDMADFAYQIKENPQFLEEIQIETQRMLGRMISVGKKQVQKKKINNFHRYLFENKKQIDSLNMFLDNYAQEKKGNLINIKNIDGNYPSIGADMWNIYHLIYKQKALTAKEGISDTEKAICARVKLFLGNMDIKPIVDKFIEEQNNPEKKKKCPYTATKKFFNRRIKKKTK